MSFSNKQREVKKSKGKLAVKIFEKINQKIPVDKT